MICYHPIGLVSFNGAEHQWFSKYVKVEDAINVNDPHFLSFPISTLWFVEHKPGMHPIKQKQVISMYSVNDLQITQKGNISIKPNLELNNMNKRNVLSVFTISN